MRRRTSRRSGEGHLAPTSSVKVVGVGGGIFPGLTWSNSLRMWLTALNGTSIESIESTHQYIVMSHESSHRAVLGSFSFGTGPRV